MAYQLLVDIFLYFCNVKNKQQMKTPNVTLAIILFFIASLMSSPAVAQNNRTGNRVFGSAKEEKKNDDKRPDVQKSSGGRSVRPTPAPAPPPMKGDMLSIRNPRPGGLKELITNDIKKRVRRLGIEGPINRDDASVIRSICNRTSCVDDRGKSVDNYLDLDLSRAIIEGSYSSQRDVAYDDMFYLTSHLRSVRLPMRLKGIGRHSFYGCSRLESVVLPYGVRYLGEGAFKGCNELEEIRLPETIEEIGVECFSGCKSLSRIILPPSVTVIGKEAFLNCPIKDLQLPDGLKSLGKWSLEGTKLRSIYIPRDTHIEEDVLGSINYLESIVVDGGNREYSSIDGVLFNHSQTKLLKIPATFQGEYAIPNSVTTIAPYAFQNCSLSSVRIPMSVTSIGEGAFLNCMNVVSFEIPNSVTVIASKVFSGCKSLRNVFLPDNVQSIGSLAFSNCIVLTRIQLPSRLLSLGKETFRSCQSLTQILIPESITAIPAQCFIGCKSLTMISLPSRLQSIDDEAFKECSSIQEITIPASVVSIGKKPFSKCNQLQRVICENTIPPSFKSKGGEKITLVVPAGSKNAYQKASQWKKFKSIVEK